MDAKSQDPRARGGAARPTPRRASAERTSQSLGNSPADRPTTRRASAGQAGQPCNGSSAPRGRYAGGGASRTRCAGSNGPATQRPSRRARQASPTPTRRSSTRRPAAQQPRHPRPAPSLWSLPSSSSESASLTESARSSASSRPCPKNLRPPPPPQPPKQATPLKKTRTGPTSTPKSKWKRGTVPELFQTDPAWADDPYAGGTIGENGCGVTCMSMVYIALTGKADMGPVEMAEFSEENDYVEANSTSWRFMTDGGAQLGLTVETLPDVASRISAEVEAGHPVIVNVGPGGIYQGRALHRPRGRGRRRAHPHPQPQRPRGQRDLVGPRHHHARRAQLLGVLGVTTEPGRDVARNSRPAPALHIDRELLANHLLGEVLHPGVRVVEPGEQLVGARLLLGVVREQVDRVGVALPVLDERVPDHVLNRDLAARLFGLVCTELYKLAAHHAREDALGVIVGSRSTRHRARRPQASCRHLPR